MRSPFVDRADELAGNWTIAQALYPRVAPDKRRALDSFRSCLEQADRVFQPEESGGDALGLLTSGSIAAAFDSANQNSLSSLAALVHQAAPGQLEGFLSAWQNKTPLPVERLAALARQGQLSGSVLVRVLRRRPDQAGLARQLLELDRLRTAHGWRESDFWDHAFRCLAVSADGGCDTARLQATIRSFPPATGLQPESHAEEASLPSGPRYHEWFNRNRPKSLVQAVRYLNRFDHTNFARFSPTGIRLARSLLANGPLLPSDPISQWMDRIGTPELAPLLRRLCGERPFPSIRASEAPSLVMAVLNDPPPPNALWLNQLLHSLHDVNPKLHLFPFSDIVRLAAELPSLQQPQLPPSLHSEIVTLCLEAMLPMTTLQVHSIATRAALLLEVLSAYGSSDKSRRLRRRLIKWQKPSI